jgi:hypothetical protein
VIRTPATRASAPERVPASRASDGCPSHPGSLDTE